MITFQEHLAVLYDEKLLAELETGKDICNIPIIYYGGVGNLIDIKDALNLGVDAIGCSSFFCFYVNRK